MNTKNKIIFIIFQLNVWWREVVFLVALGWSLDETPTHTWTPVVPEVLGPNGE